MAKITFIEVSQGQNRRTQRDLQRFQIHSHAAAATHRQHDRRGRPHPPRRTNTVDTLIDRASVCAPESGTVKDDHAVRVHRPPRQRYPSDDECISEDEKSLALQQMHDAPVERSPSPYSKIRQHHSDFTLKAVDFFVSALTPMQLIVDGIFAVNTVYTQTLLQLMLCAEESGHGGAASVNSSVHQGQGPKHIPTYVILGTCKAISDHRNHLEKLRGQSDDLAIITNLILTSIAEGMDDLQSIVIFRRHLKTLVAATGGFYGPRISQLVRNAVLQWESCSAMVLGSPTEFADKYPLHVPYHPSEPFTSEVRCLVSELPSGFQQLARHGRLSYDVLRILARVSNTTGLPLKRNRPNRELDAFTNDKTRFASYWEACPCLGYPNDEQGRPDFQKLLMLGVIMYCYHSFTAQRVTAMLYRAVRKRLTADITRRTACLEDERDALLWVWMNAIDACQQPDAALTYRAEQLIQNAQVAFPNVTSGGDLEECLRKFFWNGAFIIRCLRFWKCSEAR